MVEKRNGGIAVDVRITIRQLGKKRAAMQAVPCTLPAVPRTLRQLITLMARAGAQGYNARLEAGENRIRPLTEGQLTDMEAVGKMAFGVVYGEKRADPDKAARDAMTAFGDGLFRVFRNAEELTDPDAPLTLAPEDEITLIRLTMLAGSIW